MAVVTNQAKFPQGYFAIARQKTGSPNSREVSFPSLLTGPGRHWTANSLTIPMIRGILVSTTKTRGPSHNQQINSPTEETK